MRRALAVLTLVVCTVGLAGCGDDDSSGSGNGTDLPTKTIDVTITGGKPKAVRFWVGNEAGDGSAKAKADEESAGIWHTHVEVPDPMPAGSKLYAYASISGISQLTSATGVADLTAVTDGDPITLPTSVDMKTTSKNSARFSSSTATVPPVSRPNERRRWPTRRDRSSISP